MILLASIFWAVIAKLTVTVDNNPSGQLATTIPKAKIKLVIILYPIIIPKIKKNKPNPTAIHAINLINLFISLCKVVSPLPASEAKFAIFPIKVSAPILMTIPAPLPSLQFVLKNAKFFASKALSFPLSPHSNDALQAIDSPVSGLLSNWRSPSILNTLKSAGIFSPVLICTTSPFTISLAETFSFWPFLVTVTWTFENDLKESIISPLFSFCIYEKKPERRIITITTTARYRLLFSSWSKP